jgi:magnesium chelatase family protein
MERDRCRCSAADLARHARRLSGPLLDRIDITVAVNRPSAAALRDQCAPDSASVRAEVVAARSMQERRLAGSGAVCNAHMTAAMLREVARVTPEAQRVLYRMHDTEQLSARGHHRVLRVARTIADLAASPQVEADHVMAAIAYRSEPARELLAA